MPSKNIDIKNDATLDSKEPIDNTEEEQMINGQYLDEYMKNGIIDTSLVVSKPDRMCLMCSRGKPSKPSTNIYRKDRDKVDQNEFKKVDKDLGQQDEEKGQNVQSASSLIVSAADTRRGRISRISVASDFSNISFSSVLSDDDDIEEEGKTDNALQRDIKKESGSGKENDLKAPSIVLPSSGLVSNEWRKKLLMVPMASSNTVTKLERTLTDYVKKELLALREKNEKHDDGGGGGGGGDKKIDENKNKRGESTVDPLLSSYAVTKKNMPLSANTSLIYENGSLPSKTPPLISTVNDNKYDDIDKHLKIYTNALQQLIGSHEMKPYRFILNEYIQLSNKKLNFVDEYKIKINELSSLLGSVEIKAQKKIVAVYKHSHLESEKLKLKLHQCQINHNRDQQIFFNRENVYKKEILMIKKNMSIMETQREKTKHVNDILLKYFEKHALWKSDDEDPNIFSLMNRNGSSNNNSSSNNHNDDENPELLQELLISSLSMSRSSNLVESRGDKRISSLQKKKKLAAVDEEDVRLERSLALADRNNEASAAHDKNHELAEWKQIHLSMTAMTDSHMAAVNGLQDMTVLHQKQMNELKEKIEQLENEKALLLIDKGPGPTPIPTDIIMLKEKSVKSIECTDDTTPTKKTTVATTTNNNNKSDNITTATTNDCSTVASRLQPSSPLKRERTNYDGLAPIVVEILKRRPLPALDADAVIIKEKKKIIHSRSSMKKQKRVGESENNNVAVVVVVVVFITITITIIIIITIIINRMF
jgi:hypothetical protein